MPDSHANFGYSTVTVAPVPATSGVGMTVASGTTFPAVSFNATVWPAASQPTAANAEIVRVTANAAGVLTIVRAQESSSARTIVVGDQVAATVTAKTLTDVETESVAKVLYDANTVLAADTDNTPAAVTMAASTILARLAAGNIKAATPAELRTLLDVPTNAEAILDAIVDTKGDLIVGTAADTVARLAVGANGKVVVAASGETTGLKYDFPPGYEIGYDQITSNVSVTSTTEASGTTVISCAAHTFDGGAVMVECSFPTVVISSAVDTQVLISLFESSTQIHRLVTYYFANIGQTVALSLAGGCRFTPSAGSHTYTVTAYRVGANQTIQAGAGGTATSPPSWIRFVKV